MNINTAITQARRLLAKRQCQTKNTAKIILVKHGEELPENKEGVIIIEVLPHADTARSILKGTDSELICHI